MKLLRYFTIQRVERGHEVSHRNETSGWTAIVLAEEASGYTIYLPVTDVRKVHLQ